MATRRESCGWTAWKAIVAAGLAVGLGAGSALAQADAAKPETAPAEKAPDKAPEKTGDKPVEKAPAKPTEPLLEGDLADLVEGTALAVVATGRSATEGPLWHEGMLYFTDMGGRGKPGAILKTAPGTTAPDAAGVVRGDVASPAGLAANAEGVLHVTTFREGLNRLASDGTWSKVAETFEGKKFNGTNDLVFGPDGSLYFTDFGFNSRSELKQSGVYRIAPDGTVTAQATDFTMANGIGFGPGGKVLYVTEFSPAKREVRAFDVAADGSLTNGRVFAVVEDDGATPDGVKTDERGNVYVAAARGVVIFSPDGKRIGKINVGRRTSNLAFGGADGKTLFITGGGEVSSLQMKVAGSRLK
jgi:gluconolactonase